MPETPEQKSCLIEKLPRHFRTWQRQDHRLIDASRIFDYMDGAGELYLGYRFDHLQVSEYAAPDALANILVEVYKMQHEQDAFGLLSLDWDGEPVRILDQNQQNRPGTINPYHALYAAGLLRVWAGPYYVRLMAVRETPETRATLVRLARLLVQHQISQKYPHDLNLLSPTIDAYTLITQRVHFFRSYLVLNSLYFLAQENILQLDLSCKALLVFYSHRSRLAERPCLVIRYPAADKARAALASFIKAYIPEKKDRAASETFGLYQTEEGWMGYQQTEHTLLLTFEHTTRETAALFLKHLLSERV